MDIKKIDQNLKESSNTNSNVKYINLNNQYLRGLAFNNDFKRLDEKYFISESVNTLHKHPSGVNITFKTNSKVIKIKAALDGKGYMAHMTAVAILGFDLYYKHEGEFVFVSTTKVDKANYEVVLLDDIDDSEKEFRLYFPLYRALEEAYIGIEEDARFEYVKEESEKVVIYGTSITQGGSVTRPGMSYTNILDRITNYEIINLGFSGSAHLEEEMTDVINAIDKKYLILEVEANNTHQSLVEKLPNFLNKLKDKNIILVSHFPHSQALIKKSLKAAIEKNYQFQKQFENLLFLDGRKLLKKLNYEGTVDGVHLTDLGCYYLAHELKKYLK